jgi:hypothetical protein
MLSQPVVLIFMEASSPTPALWIQGSENKMDDGREAEISHEAQD